MNVTALAKILPVYSACDTDTHRAVHAAVTAALGLECRSPVVIAGIDNLSALYEISADLPDIERAERYVAECWAEYTPPTDGTIYKGGVVA